MSVLVDLSVFNGTDPVLEIAEEVFTAMIDGEPGLVRPWEGDVPAFVDEIHAWVDVHGPHPGRVLVSTEAVTAQLLARALLGMDADEPVSDADLVGALGEVASVVGGNVKALVSDPHSLGLPQVDRARPATPGEPHHLLRLGWRGARREVSIWSLA